MKAPRVCQAAGFAWLAFASDAVGQSTAAYMASKDTLRYEVRDPYAVTWIRGADTLRGPSASGWMAESHVWHTTPAGPEVTIRTVGVDANRRTSVSTFSISREGRVLLKNGKPPTPDVWADVFPLLPPGKIRLGQEWVDTIALRDTKGHYRYHKVRRYRLDRVFDSLGSRLLEMSATGVVRLRHVYALDTTGNTASWIDVEGAMTEHVFFDVSQGRLIRRRVWKDLSGRGMPAAGFDTVQARFQSSTHYELNTSASALFLLDELPGSDTSATYSQALGEYVMLHTVQRDSSWITSSLVSNDGRLGVAKLHHSSGRIFDYSATWADTAGRLQHQSIAVRRDSLTLSRTGGRDTVFVVPARRWAVADEGMEEHLVPALLGLPRDGKAYPFAAFRPYHARWDLGSVAIERVENGLLAVGLSFPNGTTVVLALTPDGDYLAGETLLPERTIRAPIDGLRARLYETKSAQAKRPRSQ